MTLDVEIPGREPLALTELVLTADTYGTADTVGRELDVSVARVADGDGKRRCVEILGAERCAAIGNGANDVAMLASAAIGIAVLGPEGASRCALVAADAVCRSIEEALRLVVDPLALAATLRA